MNEEIPKKHYVDNIKFSEELEKYSNQVKYAKENNLEIPSVNNYIGDCFMKIAENFSYYKNFIRYSYRDEMVLDGIENCLKVVQNFDPLKCIWIYHPEIKKTKFITKAEYQKFLEDGWLDGKYNKKTDTIIQSPSKGYNPHAYFTQICYNAFVRRIKEEKKEQDLKYKYINQLDLSELISETADDAEIQQYFLEILKSNTIDHDVPETKKKTKVSKKEIDIFEMI